MELKDYICKCEGRILISICEKKKKKGKIKGNEKRWIASKNFKFTLSRDKILNSYLPKKREKFRKCDTFKKAKKKFKF